MYCHFFDKLPLDRYYNKHLNSQTHKNSFRKRQQLNNTNNLTSFSTTNNALEFEKKMFF